MSDPVYAHMLTQIGTADDIKTLRGLRDQIHRQMEALLLECPVERLYSTLNEMHDALIGRVMVLAEEQMARSGNGSPPVPYAYILFGSGGREEQTLSSDQDSGLLYEDPDDEASRDDASRYFRDFAEIAVQMLQQLGYPPCDGGVISSNPEWRMSLSEWKTKLNGWFQDPDWERVRYLLIVADGRCVYGELKLMQAFQDHFYSDMLRNPIIVKHMLSNTMRHKVLIGVFGQLLKEEYGQDAGSLDVKYGAYIPMVNAVRMMAVQSGLRESSTLERLRGLLEKGKLSSEDAHAYSEAFRLFLRLRLMTTERSVDGMFANTGKLASSKLSKELTDELKSSLRVGKKLERRVNKQTT
ncbi:DUF294 nucleotidyltransferase-like domain-containing protein [Paenibacillus mendelii]|uniref:DUF294 nucleotidyltransferase-like domain-containing protein n=1 Tax=Paenibacillus mendelii TaxID=206163 RepID=A0ABV6JA56_9BACL|nr:DUF294 nucleotidyltransferase-like domain-containing protein [Paenibacillus mendelii]MCQ6560927.1 DUF294 nucleotidyltransferase-like domain-containing protein [Paenibacillus mendelii]